MGREVTADGPAVGYIRFLKSSQGEGREPSGDGLHRGKLRL